MHFCFVCLQVNSTVVELMRTISLFVDIGNVTEAELRERVDRALNTSRTAKSASHSLVFLHLCYSFHHSIPIVSSGYIIVHVCVSP